MRETANLSCLEPPYLGEEVTWVKGSCHYSLPCVQRRNSFCCRVLLGLLHLTPGLSQGTLLCARLGGIKCHSVRGIQEKTPLSSFLLASLLNVCIGSKKIAHQGQFTEFCRQRISPQDGNGCQPLGRWPTKSGLCLQLDHVPGKAPSPADRDAEPQGCDLVHLFIYGVRAPAPSPAATPRTLRSTRVLGSLDPWIRPPKDAVS